MVPSSKIGKWESRTMFSVKIFLVLTWLIFRYDQDTQVTCSLSSESDQSRGDRFGSHLHSSASQASAG